MSEKCGKLSGKGSGQESYDLCGLSFGGKGLGDLTRILSNGYRASTLGDS